MYRLLSLLLSGTAAARAVDDVWESGAKDRADRAGSVEAENDDALRDTHLWSPDAGRWIERGAVYRGSALEME